MTDPYRDSVERAFCCHRIPLPIPEIDVDGSERWHEACQDVARQRCRRCDAPLCDLHAPPANRCCSACESQFERSVDVAPGQAALLTGQERAIRIALCVALAGIAPLMAWIALDVLRHSRASSWILALGAVLFGLAFHIADPLLEDNRRRRWRRDFLRCGVGER